MKMCGGMHVQLHRFLTSALDESEGVSGQLYAPATLCPEENLWHPLAVR